MNLFIKWKFWGIVSLISWIYFLLIFDVNDIRFLSLLWIVPLIILCSCMLYSESQEKT